MTETTRGGTARDPGRQRESELVSLLEEVRKTLNRGGSALIPVFALGRMQEMLVVLDEAFRRKAIPKVPVFCSGLGMDLVNHFHEISQNTNRLRFNRKVLKSEARPSLKLSPGGLLHERHLSRQQRHDGRTYPLSLPGLIIVTEIPSSLWATAIPTPRAVNFSKPKPDNL